jgi:thiamine-monophosphate kinase
MQKSGSQSEFEIIRRYFSRSGLAFEKKGVALGIGDDAALLDLPVGKSLAMSMDVLVSDVHFPAIADPRLIANRALAVNLSDLAAMGAEPLCFTLGLVLPSSDEAWLREFSEGLLPLAEQYNCPLIGGDISRGPLSISIQVHGLCDKSKAVLRSGASVGDKIYASGTLGDGGIALLTLGLGSHLGDAFELNETEPSAACQQFFEEAYYKPKPRVELGIAAGKLMTSCIDISDGLYGDLNHILNASGVAAQLNLAKLPFSASARSCVDDDNRIQAALYGGDDYELCFTVPADKCAELEQVAGQLDISVTCIGEIVAKSGMSNGISYIGDNALIEKVEPLSFQHFNSTAAD